MKATTVCVRGLMSLSVILVFALSSARADIIFSNTQVDENGTGFGNRLTVLSVQQKGNATTEFGSILWNEDADEDSGDSTIQSATRSVAELLSINVTQNDFKVVFNINEGGDVAPVLTLHDFSLVFQDPTGAELFRETFSAGAGLELDQAGSGNGASGWLFEVVFTGNAAAAAAFFTNLNNRVGMEIAQNEAIQNTKGGAESFYVVAVPEPSSQILLLSSLAILCLRRRKWRL